MENVNGVFDIISIKVAVKFTLPIGCLTDNSFRREY